MNIVSAYAVLVDRYTSPSLGFRTSMRNAVFMASYRNYDVIVRKNAVKGTAIWEHGLPDNREFIFEIEDRAWLELADVLNAYALNLRNLIPFIERAWDREIMSFSNRDLTFNPEPLKPGNAVNTYVKYIPVEKRGLGDFLITVEVEDYMITSRILDPLSEKTLAQKRANVASFKLPFLIYAGVFRREFKNILLPIVQDARRLKV